VGYHVALTREAARRQSDARLEEMIRERSLRQTLKLAADYRVPMHFPDRDLAAGVLQKDVGAASACSNRVPAQPWIVAMANGRFTSRSAVRNIAQSATSASRVRRDKAALSSGCEPHPATAPAGSNRSSHGGDEMAEAFGVAGHV
jgi:hypothetical protein